MNVAISPGEVALKRTYLLPKDYDYRRSRMIILGIITAAAMAKETKSRCDFSLFVFFWGVRGMQENTYSKI